MLERIRQQMTESSAFGNIDNESAGHFGSDCRTQAAVLLALTDNPDNPELVLTKRAGHLSSHSGEVSFPGGKQDPEDASLLVTALRETEEEVGLSPHHVEVIGSLPKRRTVWDVLVTPYVGIIPEAVDLTPNYDELDSIFRVPLSFFLADERQRTDLFYRNQTEFWVPAYHYQGYEIWGFTAGVLVSFLNHALNAGIVRDNPAPEKRYD